MSACTLAPKTLNSSTFNLRAMVLSPHTIYLKALLNMLVGKTTALTLSALWSPEKYTVKSSHILPCPYYRSSLTLITNAAFLCVSLNFSNLPPYIYVPIVRLWYFFCFCLQSWQKSSSVHSINKHAPHGLFVFWKKVIYLSETWVTTCHNAR